MSTPEAPEHYPCQVGIYCDDCGINDVRDYLVSDEDGQKARFEYARAALRREGWKCDMNGDLCPDCAEPAPAQATDLRGQIDKWRATADLDARAGEPVGKALREAASTVERLRRELAEALDGQLEYANRAIANGERADQAEATIERVKAIADRDPDECGPSEDRGITCPTAADLRAALDQPGDQEGTT